MSALENRDKLFGLISQGRKYVLAMKAETREGFFYCPVEIKGDEPIGYILARLQDAFTVVSGMDR